MGALPSYSVHEVSENHSHSESHPFSAVEAHLLSPLPPPPTYPLFVTGALPSTITPADAQRVPWAAVVIGAGPAGSVAAIQLARAGLATLLLDGAPPPRSKVCGCCLAPSGVLALQRLDLSAVLHDAAPLSQLRILSPPCSATLPLPGYLSIARDTLDTRLVELARDAGAHLLWPASARARPDGSILLSSHETSGALHASVVIIADGLAGSALRDCVGAPWRINRASRMGTGVILDEPPLPIKPHEILMLCSPEGYLGLVRLPSGAYDLAGAFDPPALRAAGGPAPLAARILHQAGADTRAALAAHWKATPLLTRSRKVVELGRLLIVGDAAGFVEPFTGEGISWAIRSAAHASIHAIRIAGMNKTYCTAPSLSLGERKQYLSASTRGGGLSWTADRNRLLRRRHILCALFSRALRSPRLLRAALRLADASPRFAALLLRPFSSPNLTSHTNPSAEIA